MTSPDPVTRPIYVPKAPNTVYRANVLNLANLILRESSHKVTVLDNDQGINPEIYVVTMVDWRDADLSRPILGQLPRVLSLLETLRGTRGVPCEVYLDSAEGLAVYLPAGMRVSDIPEEPKESLKMLMETIETTLVHFFATMREVEDWFWRAARKRGFSPEIVDKMGRREKGFESRETTQRFHRLLRRYFSIRFRIHSSENCLRVEA
ncbi:MAG: hypothetical protein RTU92_02570 [Candidatus Thorarchaeota archaeon]